MPHAVFELGLNHLGDANRARRMVDALVAQEATHMTLQVIANSASFSRDAERVQALERNCLSLEENLSVLQYAVNRGLHVGAAVLEPNIVPHLVQVGVSFFKVLSSDITFDPLLRVLSSTGLGVYLSTGASTVDEIARAIQVMRAVSSQTDVRLIHTVLQVPTSPHLLNLLNIPTLAETFKVPVAYGQHSDNQQALFTALALGAEAVFVYVAEKYEPNLPDGPNAILCDEVTDLLRRLKEVQTMLGSRQRLISPEETSVRKLIRRSIVAAQPIQKGTCITEASLSFKRPGTGLPPQEAQRLIGRTADRDYAPNDNLFCGISLEDNAGGH